MGREKVCDAGWASGPLQLGLSVGQLTAWSLSSFSANKQEKV